MKQVLPYQGVSLNKNKRSIQRTLDALEHSSKYSIYAMHGLDVLDMVLGLAMSPQVDELFKNVLCDELLSLSKPHKVSKLKCM